MTYIYGGKGYDLYKSKLNLFAPSNLPSTHQLPPLQPPPQKKKEERKNNNSGLSSQTLLCHLSTEQKCIVPLLKEYIIQ